MNENSVVSLRQKDEIDDPLTEILRTGARRLQVLVQTAKGRHIWREHPFGGREPEC